MADHHKDYMRILNSGRTRDVNAARLERLLEDVESARTREEAINQAERSGKPVLLEVKHRNFGVFAVTDRKTAMPDRSLQIGRDTRIPGDIPQSVAAASAGAAVGYRLSRGAPGPVRVAATAAGALVGASASVTGAVDRLRAALPTPSLAEVGFTVHMNIARAKAYWQGKGFAFDMHRRVVGNIIKRQAQDKIGSEAFAFSDPELTANHRDVRAGIAAIKDKIRKAPAVRETPRETPREMPRERTPRGRAALERDMLEHNELMRVTIRAQGRLVSHVAHGAIAAGDVIDHIASRAHTSPAENPAAPAPLLRQWQRRGKDGRLHTVRRRELWR